MPPTRRKWSFPRWRRRWRERRERLALKWRIWFHRHVLSQERRQRWRRRWRRRTDRLARGVEQAGYKMVPHRPDAAPTTWHQQLGRRAQGWLDHKYPPEARVRHAAAWRGVWLENTAPVRQFNRRVRRWIDDYLLGNLSPVTFRRRFWNWRGLVGGVVVIALLVGGIFWAWPAWRSHQQEKWAARARLLLNRGYITLAYQHAIRTLRANEQHVEANRVIADLVERQGSPDALTWRRKVVAASPVLTNQLALAASAIRFEPPPSATAARLLEETAATGSNTLNYRVVAAQFELRNGNLPQAEAHYLAALRAEPDNVEIELALATLRLQGRDALRLELAEQALESLATRTNIGIRALRPLVAVQAARGRYAEAKDYSARVLAAENSTFEDRLVHLRVLTESRDPKRDAFLRTLQDQVSANALFAAQLATWMAGNSLARPALQWLDGLPGPLRTTEPVLLCAAEIQAGLGDWPGLERRLTTQRWGTLEFARLAWLARSYRGLGDRRAATEHLRRSTELASGMALRLAAIYRTLVTWGWTAEAEDVLWTIFERFPAEAWAPDLLQKRFFAQGNIDGLRRVFELQLKRSPRDPYLMNNLAMLLLLQRTDLPTAHGMAREIHERVPGSATYTSTFAFSLHVQGRSREALTLLETLGPETLKVPGIAAYYAIIAGAAGEPAKAREYAVLARSARLLPQETALLEAAANPVTPAPKGR